MRHVDIVALLGSFAWLLLIVEMVRRRRFSEGYSLLWLLSGIVLVVLALWRELLDLLAHALGIFYPPTALFVIAFGFVLLLMVQQSSIICELQRKNADLTQQMALLSLEVERLGRQKDSLGEVTQHRAATKTTAVAEGER